MVIIILFVFVYFGYNTHLTGSKQEISHDDHREAIIKDKQIWQQKQAMVSHTYIEDRNREYEK